MIHVYGWRQCKKKRNTYRVRKNESPMKNWLGYYKYLLSPWDEAHGDVQKNKAQWNYGFGWIGRWYHRTNLRLCSNMKTFFHVYTVKSTNMPYTPIKPWERWINEQRLTNFKIIEFQKIFKNKKILLESIKADVYLSNSFFLSNDGTFALISFNNVSRSKEVNAFL